MRLIEISAIVLLVSAVTAAAQQSAPADTQKGEALYTQFGCFGCHGYSGENGPGTRLVGSSRLATLAAFTTYVRKPTRMPAYSPDVISDAQLADMYAYIRTLKASPPAENIPLLNDLLNENQ